MTEQTKSTVEAVTYEVVTKIDPETGDTILPIPPELLQRMGWKEGDELDIGHDTEGRIVFTKRGVT
jgi:hypothetical protein